MKRELKIFLTSLIFYTRIPCGRWIDDSRIHLNEATKYLPVVGWIAGSLSALVFLGAAYLFNAPIAIALSMAASVLLTGAFHEDGFADFCDGFGGGWTKEKILEIMKDSRIGTYGAVGLVLMLLTRFLALQQLASFVDAQPLLLALLFISAHSLSRFMAAAFIFTHPYVRLSTDGKAKPVAENVPRNAFAVSALFALLPLAAVVVVTGKPVFFVVIIPLYLLKRYLGWYFTRWIGGYTGDCLGASQQLSEIMLYLTYILVWKFT